MGRQRGAHARSGPKLAVANVLRILQLDVVVQEARLHLACVVADQDASPAVTFVVTTLAFEKVGHVASPPSDWVSGACRRHADQLVQLLRRVLASSV